MVRRGRWPPKTPTRSYAAAVPGTAPVTPTSDVDGDDGAGVDVDHGECDCNECDDSPDCDASDLAFFLEVTPRRRGRGGDDSHAGECMRGCGVGAAEAVAAAIVALSRVGLDADDDYDDGVVADRRKMSMGGNDRRGCGGGGNHSDASECMRGCGGGAAEAVAASIAAIRRTELQVDDDVKDDVSPDRRKKSMFRKNGNSNEQQRRGSTMHDIGTTCDRLIYCASACLGGFGGIIPMCDDVSPWEIFCGGAFDGKISCGRRRCDCRCCGGKLLINFATPFGAASPADVFYHSRGPAPASNSLATVSDDGGIDDGDSTNLGIVQICWMESFGLPLSLELGLQSYRDASSLVDDASAASVSGSSLLVDASAVSSDPVAAAPEPLISRTDTCEGNDSYPPSKKSVPDTATHRWNGAGRLGIAPMNRIDDRIMFGIFSSGGNNISEWKDRGSNNRHCKTLSRILIESNNAYFSSVITAAETEEVTNGGEPPPLRATGSPLLSANDDGTYFSRTSPSTTHNQTMIRGILRHNALLVGHSTPPPRQPCQIREATTAAESDRRRAIRTSTRGRKISQEGKKNTTSKCINNDGGKQQNQNQQQPDTAPSYVKRGIPIHHASPVNRSTAPPTAGFNRAKLAEAKMKRRKLRTSKSSET